MNIMAQTNMYAETKMILSPQTHYIYKKDINLVNV